jgi:DivIVA domain-containing protein
MGFSPDEIEVKEFLVGLRGYDRDEVRSFLRAVADDYRRTAAALGGSQGPDPESDDAFQSVALEVADILRSVANMRERSEAEVTRLRRRAKDVLGRAVSALEAVRAAQQEAEKTIQRWTSGLNSLLQHTASEQTHLQGLGRELERKIGDAEKSIEEVRRQLIAEQGSAEQRGQQQSPEQAMAPTMGVVDEAPDPEKLSS